MKFYLTKSEGKRILFLSLEIDGYILIRIEGVEGGKSVKSGRNLVTNENALLYANTVANEYETKGYERQSIKPKYLTETIVFDKAKWHFNGDFPAELPIYQGYVHTGLYIGWLLYKGHFDSEFKTEFAEEIQQFLNREITGTSFYEQYMDGVFATDEMDDDAIPFTLYYFGENFGDSLYLKDYITVVGDNLPTLYHAEDSWENYDKLFPLIEASYNEWLKPNNNLQ